jgi:protein SCO1/2
LPAGSSVSRLPPNFSMNQSPRKIGWFAWGGVVLVFLTITLAVLLVQLRGRVGSSASLPVLGEVADFSLTNYSGKAISLVDLRGHVWVADIIFTRCPGPCLKMSRQMKQLQESIPNDSQARLVSLTTDPDYDKPPILKAYAERIGGVADRWMFLTGTKQQIARLATDSLKLAAVDKKPEERDSADDLFIHTTIFVVVDKQARLRGVFETMGEGVDWEKARSDILAAVKNLERES